MHTQHFLYLPFFINATATTELYTLSLHDALPISSVCPRSSNTMVPPTANAVFAWCTAVACTNGEHCVRDRKSTRLNSSHVRISYAVFCLKKKSESRS